MAHVKGIQGSKVPTTGAPSRGSTGVSKHLKGTNPASQSVVPATRAPSGNPTRGGPAKTAPRGKGVISSGGGSFNQS